MPNPDQPPIGDDEADLAAWTQQRNEEALAALIHRHTALVMGICRRRLGGGLADEAAQAVFIVLARRSGSISDATNLGSWLHRVSIRVCDQARRAAARRTRHERDAAALNRPHPESEPAALWSDLRPHLDAAIAGLSAPQRAVVVGHFLEGLTQSAVAKRLGISEDAAHQRLHYALAKLRTWFGRRGMAIALGALISGLTSEAGAAEPAISAVCTQAALHPGSAAGAAALANHTLAGGKLLMFAGIAGAALAVLTIGATAWYRQEPAPAQRETYLASEDFEGDGHLSAGWYDHRSFISSSAQPAPGSRHAAEFRFVAGGETPLASGTSRREFAPTDSLRIGLWIRYSPNWELTGRSYSVVQFLVMTTADGRFDAPSYTHLSCAVGVALGVPFVSLQDGRNIDAERIGIDLSGRSEARAVAGGNGGDGAAFRRPDGSWANVLRLPAGDAAISETGTSTWHRVEIGLRLNRIVDGRAIRDGEISYCVDGQIALDRHDVLFRTAMHADMHFNQFILAPWSDGVPHEQTFWIDDLTIAAAPQDTPPTATRNTP